MNIPLLFALEDGLAVPSIPEGLEALYTEPHRATVQWDGLPVKYEDGEVYAWEDGWVPVEPSGEKHAAYRNGFLNLADNPPNGTYELVGPGVNGNPYEQDTHKFILHGVHFIEDLVLRGLNEYEAHERLKAFLSQWWMKGVVFWSGDTGGEPVAMIRKQDFGFAWPEEGSAL